ncbi:MAG: Cna B-type domain-containing protein, partial [Lachnospiraceae bacterium]|nr:Cna B-type domain-containing protein [Lachnospiraceae bacterium]
LEVESYQYIKDGEVVAESTATFDPDTLKLVTPVEEVVIGAEFTNPYKPEPTEYQPKVTKVIAIDYGPIVREKIFNFELTLLEQVDAAGDPIEDGAIIPEGGDKTTLTIPAGGTTDIALFGNIRFDKAGTYTFKIVETAEDEEGITYDAAEWTLIVVIRDTDNELEVESYQYIKDGEVVAESTATFDPDTLKLVTPVEEVVIGAEFTNPYKPEPTEYQPRVTKVVTIDYGPLVREKIFNFELTLVDQVDAAGDAMEEGVIIAEGGDKLTLTIPAGEVTNTALFEALQFVKAGTFTFQINETEEDEEGITYDLGVWTLILVIRDTDHELEVESYQYIKDGEVVEESYAVFDEETLKLVEPVADTVIGAEFTNPYKPEPTNYQPKVTKVITIDYGPIVREKIFNFELTLLEQVDAAGDPIEDGAIIPEGGDHATVIIPAGGTTDIALFGNIRFDKAGTYTFKIVETAEDEEGITYDAAEWTLIIVIRDTDNELEVESYQYIKDGEIVAESEAVFDEETLKLVEPVEDTVIGAEFINPYKPEPTNYQPKVTKVIELGYGPTVAEKIFNFELTLLTQVDAAGNEIEGGAIIPEGGDHTTLTIPAGEVTDIALFGDIEFVKAGTYTFQIVETAENEEGITYDAAEWTLTVVIRDTDPELVVESYAYEKDGEVVDHSEATFDEETGKVVDEVADTVIGAEFINPYKPAPTEYPAKVMKTVIGEPTVADKYFHFIMEASDENPAGASLTSSDEALAVEIKVPAGTTGAGVEAFFEAVTFDRAGTFVFTITELLEDEEGVTYDGTVWTLTVVVTDTDGILEISDTQYEAEDKAPSLELAFFENPYAPSPINAYAHVTKTLSGQTPSEDTTFEFVLTAATLVPGGSFMGDEEIMVGDNWTKTIVGAGTVDFDTIKYVKAGTYTYTLTETDTHANGWTYSAVVWTFTVTVTDTDGFLACETLYTAGEETGTTAEFINYYEPNPVEWNPEVQKVLSEDSDLTRADATFRFLLKFVEADVEGGCSLTADDSILVETLLPAGEFESEPVAFDKITFTKAGLYTFEITEIDDEALGFTYDTTPKTLKVKVIDVSGDLTVNSVTVDGGEADIDGTKVVVIVENEYEEFRTEVSGIKTWIGDEFEEHVRPVSITIRLYADGVEIAHKVVTKEDNWTYTFGDLLKYNTDGTLISYTITEDRVLGYITEYSGYSVINRRIPDTGDTSILPWAIAMGGSVAALGGVLLVTKKKRKEDEEE